MKTWVKYIKSDDDDDDDDNKTMPRKKFVKKDNNKSKLTTMINYQMMFVCTAFFDFYIFVLRL